MSITTAHAISCMTPVSSQRQCKCRWKCGWVGSCRRRCDGPDASATGGSPRPAHARRGRRETPARRGCRGGGQAHHRPGALWCEPHLQPWPCASGGGRTVTPPSPGFNPADLIPQSRTALHERVDEWLAVGFSKFILRPVGPPADWTAELGGLGRRHPVAPDMTASWAPSTPPGAQPVSSGLRISAPVSGASSTEDERPWRSKR